MTSLSSSSNRPPLRPASSEAPQIHPSAVVEEGVELSQGVVIWHFCHVCAAASVGHSSSIGQGCYIGPFVTVGAFVRMQNHVSLFPGVNIEDEVFLGPSCVFSNVVRPRARLDQRGSVARTEVRRGATVGANATILPGLSLGRHCFVGAGAVVTRDVPDYAQVVGNPARVVGFVSRHGALLQFDESGRASCPLSGLVYERQGKDQVRCMQLAEEDALSP